MKRLIAALILLTASYVSADSCDPCWSTCGPCGDFDIGAQYLYWKPAICDYKIAEKSFDNNNRTEIVGIKPDYDSGVRAWLGYYRDCSFAQVSYLWLETHDTFTIELDGATSMTIPGTGFLFNRVRPTLKLQYQNADVKVGQYLHRGRACTFGVYGNFRWVDIERRLHVRGFSANSQARLEQKSQFDGGGLGVGMTGDFCIWNGFSGFGEFGAMAVLGERRFPTWQTARSGLPTSIVRTSEVTCVIPAVDFRVGINYAWDCLCTTVLFELGYELDYYWAALKYADLPAAAETIVTGGPIRCRDVGFAGPFLGVHALF